MPHSLYFNQHAHLFVVRIGRAGCEQTNGVKIKFII